MEGPGTPSPTREDRRLPAIQAICVSPARGLGSLGLGAGLGPLGLLVGDAGMRQLSVLWNQEVVVA